MNQLGGLWAGVPYMGTAFLIFSLASLGLPGMGNFIGEFLVLLGSYQANVPMTVLAALGVVAATVYSLWIVQRVFLGPLKQTFKIPDLSWREIGIMTALTIAILWTGLYPQPVLNRAQSIIRVLKQQGPPVQTARVVPSPNKLTDITHNNRISS